MNTKKMVKADSYSKSNFIKLEQSQSKARSSPCDTEAEEDTEAVFQSLSSPTFNIHIHVPHYDSESSKIQPIINVYFDEFAKKLDSNLHKKNKKILYKKFQTSLKNMSPKTEVAKFHFKNNSEEKDIQESEIINETPKSSQKHSNDMGLNKNINSEEVQNEVTKTSETTIINNFENKSSNSNNINNCNNHDLLSYKLSKNFKLKKAVVVLTDICKSKNYKHFFEKNESCRNENNESEISCNNEVKLENNCCAKEEYRAQIFSIKTENESCSPGSFTTEWKKDNIDVLENCLVDTDVNLHMKKNINNKSFIEKICNKKDQSFTALVEGWNFSDILKRFQSKHGDKFDNFLASSNSVYESKSDIGKMDDDNELNHKLTEKNICIREEGFEQESYSNNYSNNNNLHMEIIKTEVESNEENLFGENVSDIAESISFVQSQSETENVFLMKGLNIFNEDSKYELKKMTKENIESEFAHDLGSDEHEIISGKEVSSGGILDMEVVEHDLSSIMSNAVQENKFELPKTYKSSLPNIASPRFSLKLIKKEMQRRTLIADKTHKNSKSMKCDVKSSPPGKTLSPKKKKLSDGNPEISEKKNKKKSKAENFIRLKSSGPTEFSVVSLNKVKPSVSAVKDFKRNMLFGNRVKRFSDANLLRIYQLKKDAIRKAMK